MISYYLPEHEWEEKSSHQIETFIRIEKKHIFIRICEKLNGKVKEGIKKKKNLHEKRLEVAAFHKIMYLIYIKVKRYKNKMSNELSILLKKLHQQYIEWL